MPYSGQRVAVDGILIPNGTILPNEQGGVFDFWSSPKKLGANLTSPDLVGGCGSGCVGYDTCWLVNREQNGPYDWRVSGPVATVSSPFSGIQIDIFSDQQAFQIYTCPGQNGMFYCISDDRTMLTLVNRNHYHQGDSGLLQPDRPTPCCPKVRLYGYGG